MLQEVAALVYRLQLKGHQVSTGLCHELDPMLSFNPDFVHLISRTKVCQYQKNYYLGLRNRNIVFAPIVVDIVAL